MEKFQITVSSHELLSKLKAVGKVIKTSNVNPLHDYFMLEVDNQLLKVTAADPEGNITAVVECEIQPEVKAKFLIESKLLLNGLKELPEQPVILSVNISDRVEVSLIHSSGHYTLQALASDNFPMILQDDETHEIIMPSSCFVEGLRATIPFAGNDDLRPIMNSIYVECKNGQVNFTATNSSIMSVKEFYNHSAGPFSFILPVKISKIMADLAGEDDIIFHIGKRNVSATLGNNFLVYRLIEGNYPNYRSVIPKNNDKILKVNTREILGALRRTSLFTNHSSLLVLLNINKNLTISGRDLDFQISAEEKLSCEWNTSESLEIGFKSTFLQQCIDAVDTEDVQLTFSDSMRACLISPADEKEDSSLTILVMPMQINL